MKDSKGFIKLDRSIFEHWIFQDAEKFKAFVDLIQLARWKDEKLLIGNDLVTIPRGSYYTSELKLAARWGWGRDKTRNFLSLLEKEGMIKKKGTTKGTMLTIENYRVYQDEHPTVYTTKTHQTNNEPDIKPTSNQHQTNNEPDTKEEIKEIIRIDKKRKEKKEREEREDSTTQLHSLSFPTHIHKIIYEQFGEVAYKTWFIDSIIKTKGELITITVKEQFKKDLIQAKYIKALSILLKKNISVKLGGSSE